MILPGNPIDAGVRIRTYSGQYIDVFDIQLNEIYIDDIAHALSNQTRFAGHCVRHYSVAEHCINVAELVPDELKLEALLHDAAETYIIDMPAPIKSMFPEYREIENNLMKMIAKKFNINWPVHSKVNQADKICLLKEWDDNVINDNLKNHLPLTPKEAKQKFLDCFYTYKNIHTEKTDI